MLNQSPQRFLYLLIALVAFVTVVPVLEELGYGGMIFTIFYSAILLSAAYAVSESRGHFILALILAGPALVLRWINYFLEVPWLQFVVEVLTVLFLLLVAMLILSHVLKAERVSREKIFGALSVYLLLGFIWAILFIMVDFLVPGSLRYGQDQALTGAQMVYYSFVTHHPGLRRYRSYCSISTCAGHPGSNHRPALSNRPGGPSGRASDHSFLEAESP